MKRKNMRTGIPKRKSTTIPRRTMQRKAKSSSLMFARQYFDKPISERLQNFVQKFGANSFEFNPLPKGISITLMTGKKQCDIAKEGSEVVARLVTFPQPQISPIGLLKARQTIDRHSREEIAQMMLAKIEKLPQQIPEIKRYRLVKGSGKSLRQALLFAINEALDELIKQ